MGPAMDEVTFKSDTVLSDVHLYTPNQRHLMVRLNGMGQPGKIPVWVEQLVACWGPLSSYFNILLLGETSSFFNQNFIAKTDKTKFAGRGGACL